MNLLSNYTMLLFKKTKGYRAARLVVVYRKEEGVWTHWVMFIPIKLVLLCVTKDINVTTIKGCTTFNYDNPNATVTHRSLLFNSDWRCEDRVSNCVEYDSDLCTNPSYTAWVNLYCRKYCEVCTYCYLASIVKPVWKIFLHILCIMYIVYCELHI